METVKEEILLELLEVITAIMLQKKSLFSSCSIGKAYIMILICYTMFLFHAADALQPFLTLRASDQELVVKTLKLTR